MDAVDQTSTHCPCHWEQHARNEYAKHTYWDQKMMLVIVEGNPYKLRYYAGTPYVGYLCV
jgi:hypothetical protein